MSPNPDPNSLRFQEKAELEAHLERTLHFFGYPHGAQKEIPPEPVASRSRTVQFAENVEMRYYQPYRGHPEIVGRHTEETFPYTSFIAFGLFLLGLAAMTQDQYA